MDPPKLTKSTFCGPLSLKFPTGDEIDREFPGPDLIFCVSILGWFSVSRFDYNGAERSHDL